MTKFKLNEVAWSFRDNLVIDQDYIHHLDKNGVFIEQIPVVTEFTDDLCFDNRGNLYIATTRFINKIPNGSTVEELFFTFVRTNWNVRPVTPDSKGKFLYTADSDTNDASSTHWVILKLDQDGVEQQRWSFARGYDGDFSMEPHALALYDNDTKIAWVTQFSLRVRSLDLITGVPSTLFMLPPLVDGFGTNPQDIIVLDDNTVLIANDEWLLVMDMAGTILTKVAPWDSRYLNQSDPGNSSFNRFDLTKDKKSLWIVYEDSWAFSPEFPIGAFHVSLVNNSLDVLHHYRFPRVKNDSDWAIAVNNKVSAGGSFGTVIGAT